MFASLKVQVKITNCSSQLYRLLQFPLQSLQLAGQAGNHVNDFGGILDESVNQFPFQKSALYCSVVELRCVLRCLNVEKLRSAVANETGICERQLEASH